MRRAETIASARIAGPLLAIDAGGDPVEGEDFDGAGELEVRVDDAAFGPAGGGSIMEMGHGWYGYPATGPETQCAALSVKIAGVCQEFTLLENVERFPQGIALGETDIVARRVRGLSAFDNDDESIDAENINVEVSLNAATWSPASGVLTGDDGYPYYDPTDSEIGERGWLAVRLSDEDGVELCVVRVDIVGPLPGLSIAPQGTGPGASVIEIDVGDLALTWLAEQGVADLSITGTDLTADRGLVTAVLLSLFTDRRAEDDDVPPSGDATDRRGWWADEFLEVEGDKYGSRLWLLDRAKQTTETARRAEEYDREALQWMLDDRVVATVGVTIELTARGIVHAIELGRPGKDPVTFRFAHTWDGFNAG